MDIPRTDSPVTGFYEFDSPMPLTRPSPGWTRALSNSMPNDDDYTDDEDNMEEEWETTAEIQSLVHNLFLPSSSQDYSSKRSSVSSRASSLDSSSTICFTPCSSTLHTPSSSVDLSNRMSKSRSLASLSLCPSARRAAVYILDDDEEQQMVEFPSYSEKIQDILSPVPSEDEASPDPPSRFSIDEEERPRLNIRDIISRTRAISMSAPRPLPTTPSTDTPTRPAFQFPQMASPQMPMSAALPPPTPTTAKKSKRKTVLSFFNLSR
ncbi:hypothetical protein CYLTODRAFT_413657 [Cylindrobasidium torrendii FP15055 ss-10]|uniref:Uncharacterized protein n=1 Tax=Cylindrobasidium torrendii FP15055 ss-10 TaxID=1314674 RepID=A0A0D7B0G5_9AGAR|nr:hypothetical protein CYLTODRAFT_413657 [Cylindrobasidium torrendii FP15055 ss-10]